MGAELISSDAGKMPTKAHVQHARIRFIGSGHEFFRMWVVHVLLTLLTLTLYWPVARARQMSWFYRHTEILGHVLDFQPPVKSMVRSYLMIILIVAVITLPEYVAPDWAGPVLFLYAAIWPLLWWSALLFRMRQTRWQGVCMDFNGSLKDAYRLAWPLVAMAGLYVLVVPWASDQGITGWIWGTLAFVGMSVVLFPWLWTRLQRFQHSHYVFMDQQTQTDMPAESFYGVSFQYLMGLPVLVLLILGAGYLVGLWTGTAPSYQRINLFAFYIYIVIVGQAFMAAKLQNILWNHTWTERICFNSDLPVWRYVGLQCQNWLLILVTAGFFYPYAKVRSVRLRLESVAMTIEGRPLDWVSSSPEGGFYAAGEAAENQVGIDIGI